MDRIRDLQAAEVAPQLSPEWFRVRREELFSATDVSALLGLDPYKKRAKVIAVKTGELIDEFTGNMYTQHGQRHESVLRAMNEHMGAEPIELLGLLRHPRLSFIGASPDGIGTQTLRLKEFKCPVKRKLTAGEVPLSYWVQMQVQLNVCDLVEADYIEAYVSSDPCAPPTVEDVASLPPWPVPVPDATVYWTDTGLSWSGYYVIVNGEPLFSMRSDATAMVAELAALAAAEEDSKTQWFKWRCDNYHHTRVTRDDVWWAKQEPILAAAWAEVMQRRQGPLIPKKTRTKRAATDLSSASMFVSDPDE